MKPTFRVHLSEQCFLELQELAARVYAVARNIPQAEQDVEYMTRLESTYFDMMYKAWDLSSRIDIEFLKLSQLEKMSSL